MKIPFSEILEETVISHKKLSGGINNPTYKLIGKTGNNYILQFAGKKYSEKTIRQPLITKMLKERTSIPVANVIKVDNSCGIIPNKYIITECLPGVELAEIKNKLSNEQIVHLFKSIAINLSELHSIKFDAPGEIIFEETSIRIKPSGKNLKEAIIKEYSEWVKKGLNTPFEKYIPDLLKWINVNAKVFDEELNPCLTHNDFRDYNILIQENGNISGIVDLDNINSSNPVADIYRIYEYFSGEKKELGIKTFFENYTASLPKNYKKQIGFYIKTHVLAYIDCWEQIVESYSEKDLKQMIDKMIVEIEHLLTTEI